MTTPPRRRRSPTTVTFETTHPLDDATYDALRYAIIESFDLHEPEVSRNADLGLTCTATVYVATEDPPRP